MIHLKGKKYIMNYEEALTKAKTIKPDCNICIEQTSAYIFGNDKDERDGGSSSPLVILKKNGKAVSMPYYNAHYTKDKEIKTYGI